MMKTRRTMKRRTMKTRTVKKTKTKTTRMCFSRIQPMWFSWSLQGNC